MIRLGLALLGTILGASLFAIVDAEAVECTANNMVTHTGKVTHTAAANEHNGVFLEVVTFATDVSGDFLAVGQANTSDLSQRGVWFFRCCRLNRQTNTTALRATVHITSLRYLDRSLAWITDELIDRRHAYISRSY